jgi:hypothetical protein
MSDALIRLKTPISKEEILKLRTGDKRSEEHTSELQSPS